MKNLVTALLFITVSSVTFGQEAADKKYQAGLIIGSGMNFQKMETKRMATNGIGRDLTIGANVTYNFSETIGFNTGVEFDFETLNYKAANYEGKNIYYYYNDTEIQQIKDVDVNNLGTTKIYELNERQHKTVYLTIPTMAVFRTSFFGYFRYFGKFGLRNSFLLSNKMNDTGANFTDNNVQPANRVPGENKNMEGKQDVFFFKSAVGASIGAEWNFSGSTCLVGEIGYYYGFTPMHTNWNTDKGNNSLFATDYNNGLGNDVHFSNASKQQQLQLKISILF